MSETKLGRTGDAATHLATAAENLAGEPHRRLLATIRLNEAVALSAANEPRAARAAYTAALQSYVDAGAPDVDVASALRGQAATLAKLGRSREAADLYAQAVELFERGDRPDEVFRTRIGELPVRYELGLPVGAGELDQVEAALDGRPLDVVGQMSRNIGNIRLRQGDLDGAERAYDRARRAFRRLGRQGEVASVDSCRALLARDRGDLERARRMMLRVRRVQAELGNWLSVAHADVNLASLMVQVADQDDPPRLSLLRAALRRALDGVDAIDRYRHLLGTAADRAALVRHVYAGVFPVGIQLGLRTGDQDAVASLVERARVQPVLADPAAEDRAYRPPEVVDAAVLGSEAVRLAGAHARWCGWWSNSDVMVGTLTIEGRGSATRVEVLGSELADLAAALPVPLDAERAIAPDDGSAQIACLYRALSGPLVADEAAAGTVGRLLSAELRCAADSALEPIRGRDDAQLLWPVSQLVFSPHLLADLGSAVRQGRRVPLVLAPPPELGRVPWPALPLDDPRANSDAPRLVDAADLTLALPISLSLVHGRQPARRRPDGAPLLVVDPLGDLQHLRKLDMGGARRFGSNAEPATRAEVLAWARDAPLLVLGAHVRPGTDTDPAESAILLAGAEGVPDPLTVGDLGRSEVPPVCVLFTCDGAGAATGAEWTGVATGLVWGGADWVVATTCPTLEDRTAARLDQQLLDRVAELGPREGLWSWHRDLAERRRLEPSPANAPLRWAMTVVTGSPRQGAAGPGE